MRVCMSSRMHVHMVERPEAHLNSAPSFVSETSHAATRHNRRLLHKATRVVRSGSGSSKWRETLDLHADTSSAPARGPGPPDPQAPGASADAQQRPTYGASPSLSISSPRLASFPRASSGRRDLPQRHRDHDRRWANTSRPIKRPPTTLTQILGVQLPRGEKGALEF